jgi:hypothetical protein
MGRKMPSTGIDLLVTEAVVHKVMGKHDACERNYVWNIFVINIVGKNCRSKLLSIYFCSGSIRFENVPNTGNRRDF